MFRKFYFLPKVLRNAVFLNKLAANEQVYFAPEFVEPLVIKCANAASAAFLKTLRDWGPLLGLHVKALAFSHRLTFIRTFLSSYHVDERVHVADAEFASAEVQISCLEQGFVCEIELESFVRAGEPIETLKKAPFLSKKRYFYRSNRFPRWEEQSFCEVEVWGSQFWGQLVENREALQKRPHSTSSSCRKRSKAAYRSGFPTNPDDLSGN